MNQLSDFFAKLFDYSDWPPRWHCGQWTGFHGWVFIISDLLIWSAYFTIPLVIIKFISRKSDASFVKLYFLFAAFILACGATHFLDAVAFWFPLYRLSALVRFITGIISWITVFYIIRYLPMAFTFKSQKAFENEIEQRKKAETELIESKEQIQNIYKNAPDGVIVVTSKGNVVQWNPAAEKIFGWSETEVLGKVLNEVLVPEELRHIYILEMKSFLKTGHSAVLNRSTMQTVICKDNSFKEVEFTVSPVKTENDYLFIGFVRDVTAIKKATQALKESEERYRLLTSEVRDYSIIMLSPEGNISSWNEGAQRINGYPENEIIGKHFSLFFTREDLEKNLPKNCLEIAKAAGRIENDGWQVKKDGTHFWANVVITALKRGDTVIGFSKITRDITERKKTEEHIKQLNATLEQRVIERTEQLQQSENKYRKLFENSPVPMWVIELPSSNIIDVNEAAIKNYGYSREEFLSMSSVDLRPEDEKKRFLDFNPSAKHGFKKSGIWKHLKKDGSVIYVDVNSHEMNIDNHSSRIILSMDITERKKAEERLDFALEAGQIGIWEFDVQDGTSLRNLRHDQIFGYQEKVADWDLKKFIQHIYPEDAVMVKASFREALKTKNWAVETRITWPDNSVRWIMINGKVTGDDKDAPLKMLGTLRDITKYKQAEEEIKQLNNDLEQRVNNRTRELHAANKELESFSYSVSHDLRAPLRAIHGYSKILLDDNATKLDEEAVRLLNRVMFNAAKMSQLIDDLLEFSRVGKKALYKTSIDITKTVRGVVSDLGQSNKYHHNIVINELGMAIADEISIKLVFQNLLLNATKYSSKKENPLVEVGLTKTNKGETYFVKDNGAGFDMTYYSKLFGVFQRFHRQEEFEGTGVGLAIVQRIILKHGGEIWAESTVGEGATFYFTLH